MTHVPCILRVFEILLALLRVLLICHFTNPLALWHASPDLLMTFEIPILRSQYQGHKNCVFTEHRPASQLNSADSEAYEDIAEPENNHAFFIHCKMIHRLRWHFPINIHSSGELLNISPAD